MSSAPAPLVHLLRQRAVLRGEFVLRSGATSDWYFDKFLVTTDPQLLGEVARSMAALIAEHAPEAEALVAPELGAVPLATAISLESGLPCLFVRGAGKAYGTTKRIEGRLTAGLRGVLVEDVVTSGGAALEALAVARDAGVSIDAAACLLDRDGGGAQALAAAGAPLTSLLAEHDLRPTADASSRA